MTVVGTRVRYRRNDPKRKKPKTNLLLTSATYYNNDTCAWSKNNISDVYLVYVICRVFLV